MSRTVRETELADLDHELAQGPRLMRDAVFGACVGAMIGWFGSSSGKRMLTSVAQGAGAGAAVCLASYAFGQWKSAQEHKQLGPSHFAGIAPAPFYAPSLSYPWSNH
jgi:hypothetical protein